MGTSSFLRQCFVILLFIQLGNLAWAAKAKPQAMAEYEKMVIAKMKAASVEMLIKGQRQGAIKLQANFAKAMTTLSTKKSSGTLMVPMDVREKIREILNALDSGEFADPMFQGLPNILMTARGSPAEQLQVMLKDMMPRAPEKMKGPLQGLFDFVKANQAGVNKYLAKLFSGTPTLLNGVVASVASTVGATNAAVGGSTESLNTMVGGLLASVPLGGLLPG